MAWRWLTRFADSILGRRRSTGPDDTQVSDRLSRMPAVPPPLTPEQSMRQLESPPEPDDRQRFPSGAPSQQTPEDAPAQPSTPEPEARNDRYDDRDDRYGREEYDEIETLGRDASYHEDDWQAQQDRMIEVASSNVYAYSYEPESLYTGIMYVTFLAPAPKGQQRTGPGPTYAYYSVTPAKYRAFIEAAGTSVGGAVWDHLRVRGTIFGHQVQYRLVAVSGEYVPRKATQLGYRTRELPPIGTPASRRIGPLQPGERDPELRRRGFRRSTLEEVLFDARPDSDPQGI